MVGAYAELGTYDGRTSSALAIDTLGMDRSTASPTRSRQRDTTPGTDDLRIE